MEALNLFIALAFLVLLSLLLNFLLFIKILYNKEEGIHNHSINKWYDEPTYTYIVRTKKYK